MIEQIVVATVAEPRSGEVQVAGVEPRDNS
jgi:hypothetical protein